jgi:serine/threonine-protein kinase
MRTCPSCQRTYGADATQCTVDGRSLVDVSLSDTVPTDPASGSSPPVVDAVGAALAGRYEILRKIGEGGMGVVFEARHAKIGKRVAVKVLLEKYLEKPDVVARLLQEARMASSIGHENIVDITDFGETDDGRTFVVMEFLEGESLAALLDREGALPAARAVHIARQVASALGAAHEKGIVHRDVKPENIFITRRGDRDFVKVLDFGISKAMKPPDDDGPASSPRLTQTGMVIGTPLYMSPEQASGEEDLDHRIDVYALGTVLYEALTGEVPFHGPNYLSIISQILSREPRPPSEVRPELGITPDLENVVLRAMAKSRDDRYPTMAELDGDLARIEGGGSVRPPPATRLARRRVATALAWVGGVSAIVVAVALAVPRVVRDSPAQVAAEPAPVTLPAPAPAPVPAPVPPPPVVLPVAPPPEPARVKVRVTSKPPRAEVWWEAVPKGKTPLELEFPKGEERIELTLKLAGYKDARVLVIPTEDQQIPAKLDRLKIVKPPKPGPDKGLPSEIKDNPYSK